MSTVQRSRVRKGVAEGGQFSQEAKSETGVSLVAANAPSQPGKLHQQFGIGLDHQYVDAFNQMEGLRSASAAILEDYPTATTLKLEQNQDGENQWDIVEATDASGNVVATAEDLDELGVDNPQLGDVAGAIWQLNKSYPTTNGAGVMDRGRPNDFATMKVDLQAAANPNISTALIDVPNGKMGAPKFIPPHPEDALSDSGASDGYYEIVGADLKDDEAIIDLSTVDQTGGKLKHNYGTGETTWHWDGAGQGSAEDVQMAVEDITRGQKDARQLFDGFREKMNGPDEAASSKVHDSPYHALEAAGARNGHAFDISATRIEDGVGIIELDNEEGTGGELRHRYETGETTWHFDGAGQGTAQDVQIAVDDITRETYNAEELFNRFRDEMAK